MEDIERKLVFDNSLIKIQAISRLVLLLEKSKSDKSITLINESSPKIPELDKLWELTDDNCPIVSNCASAALVSLVVNGHAEYRYVVNGIFVRASSAKQFSGYVVALRDLLLLQKPKGKVEAESLGRLTQHPFSVLLKQNINAWPDILEQTKYLLELQYERQEVFDALLPFLQCVLWDPNRPSVLSSLRVSLFQTLCALYLRFTDDKLLKLLFETIHWLKLDSPLDVQETCGCLQDLSRIVTACPNGRLKQITASLATVALRMMKKNVDPSSCLQTVHTLLQKDPQVSCSSISEATALLVMLMFDSAAPLHHGILTKIADTLITKGWISPLVSASFLLPLLRIITTPLISIPILDGKPGAQQRAASLIRFIENDLKITDGSIKQCKWEDVPYPVQWESLDPSLTYALYYAFLYQTIQKTPSMAHSWLNQLQSELEYIDQQWHFLAHIVVGIVMHGLQDRQLIRKSVSIMVKLATVDKTQAPTLYPVLLHKLGIETDIDLRLFILHRLPDMATHKITVGPVLQTLKMLSSTPSLQSLSIRLTAQLWKHQDRVFPFLHHLILEEADKSKLGEDVYEIAVAKTASIYDVCESRPNQYGAELLQPLSVTLARHLNEAGIVPSVLALDSIILLCKAEVIDLHTTWKVLSPKLSKDSRPPVVKKLCELLSLIPMVEVNTKGFETFKLETVRYLWKLVCAAKDKSIVGAAYRALGYFKPDLFTLKLIPEKAKTELILPSSMAATPFERAKNPEDVLQYIPGSCFTTLLSNMHNDILSDYGFFIANQIKEEVVDLPRSIYHSTWRMNKSSQSNKLLTSVPVTLANKQETNKIPGLQGSLAGGVLLSFEPPVEFGKNSQPTRRSFVIQARAYQQKMDSLLKEVPIDAAEWQRSLALSQAWSTFMEKAYFASVEGRKAELEMQKAQGTLKFPEEFDIHLNTAWLWARDHLTESLRTAARGKPISQGNAVLALGGLAAAISKFASALDPDLQKNATAETPEHLSHGFWLNIVYETILSIMVPGRQTKNRIFTWFQCDKTTSQLSALVRACATFSVSHLAPSLASASPEKARNVLETLQAILHKSDSPPLQLYAGLGTGIFLAHLYEEHFAEIAGKTVSDMLHKATRSLLEWALSDDVDSKIGSVLGLTIASCAMCKDTNSEVRMNAVDIHSMVLEKVENEMEATVIHEVLCMSLVSITAATCTCNILPMNTAEGVLLRLEALLKKNPNVCGIASSLGLLVHWLQRVSYPSSAEMKDHLLKVWLPALASENAPTLARLAAVHGLCSLFGLQGSLIQLPEDVLEPTSYTGLNELLNIMIQIISMSKDIGLQNCCAWMLGQLYLVTSSHGRQSLPTNYSYLKPTSILAAVVEYICNEIKAGSLEVDEKEKKLIVCLGALAQEFCRPLPPLNWTALLTPIIRLSHNVELQCLALKTAVNQSASSTSAAAVVMSCMTSQLFVSLPVELQIILLSSLHHLIKSIPLTKLRSFLEEDFMAILQASPRLEPTVYAALKGLLDALQASDPPQGITLLLYETTETAYQYINCTVEDSDELFALYCECLIMLPDEVLDRLTVISGKDIDLTIEKSARIRTFLVSHEKEPLSWLNQIIDVAAVSNCDHQKIHSAIFSCLQVVGGKNDDTPITWLLEIMGQTKNILEWKTGLKLHDTDHMCQVTSFFLEVFTAAILGLASKKLSFVIWLPSEQGELMTLLPLGLHVLINTESLKGFSTKVIDWLLFLLGKAAVEDTKKLYIKASLCGLRQTKEFSRSAIWSKATTA